jgi:phosphatidyl-myo-inositol dimannoside synthase
VRTVSSAVLVTSSFLPGRGGIESYLAQLCSELAPRVAVLAPARREGRTIPDDLTYPAHRYSGSMLVPRPAIARAIIAAAQNEGTDKILFGTPWPLALLGPRLRRAGLRYAVIVHGAELLVPGAIPLLRSRLARALGGADLVLAVSNFTAGQTAGLLQRHGVRVPPIELLRARVDLERFRPDVDTGSVRARYGIPADERMVLAFGRLVRRKGIHRLIHVIGELPATAVVAGTGPQLKSLRRLATKLGAPVVFTGRVAEADAPALFAAADVFALPVADRWWGLDVEGLGVVLLEAAACHTPCVTGASGGTPEAVIDGETGFVIDARDAGALRERIAYLLGDPETAQKIGRAGRRYVADEFANRPLPEALLNWLM